MKTKEEIKEFLSQCDFQDVYSTIMRDRAKDINGDLMCIPQSYIGDEEGHHEQFGFETMEDMIKECFSQKYICDCVDSIFEFKTYL